MLPSARADPAAEPSETSAASSAAVSLRFMIPPRPRSCEPELSPGVELPVHLAQVTPIEVGIDGGGGDIRMSEQLLHDAQIRAALEQVGRERMPERVRVDPGGDAGAAGVPAQDLPPAHARERAAARIDEHRVVAD